MVEMKGKIAVIHEELEDLEANNGPPEFQAAPALVKEFILRSKHRDFNAAIKVL